MNLWKLAVDFFKVIQNIPVIVGTIKALAVAAEDTGTPGPQKKEAVIESVIKTFKEAFEIDLTPYKAWLGWILDGIINVFNMTGFFKHEEKKN